MIEAALHQVPRRESRPSGAASSRRRESPPAGSRGCRNRRPRNHAPDHRRRGRQRTTHRLPSRVQRVARPSRPVVPGWRVARRGSDGHRTLLDTSRRSPHARAPASSGRMGLADGRRGAVRRVAADDCARVGRQRAGATRRGSSCRRSRSASVPSTRAAVQRVQLTPTGCSGSCRSRPRPRSTSSQTRSPLAHDTRCVGLPLHLCLLPDRRAGGRRTGDLVARSHARPDPPWSIRHRRAAHRSHRVATGRRRC